jgi:hypothetical protein
MQLRAGAVRAVSSGVGMNSGCVAVYVRYLIFLLKRTPFAGARPLVGGAIAVLS